MQSMNEIVFLNNLENAIFLKQMLQILHSDWLLLGECVTRAQNIW